ncbi:putative gnat family acetyltransferase protein [Rosellinia necatrix]|uniref:N-alpha-acetyltransferase 40 n=1 Tax=Rosellinia necatrix TaxID=77044 RepID=A0A1W2TBX4_ROSNE|nr:putative gnat family acetyltransferase protein [Rosellinia necatrix]
MKIVASGEMAKRKRAATDPLESVNQKDDDQFINEHLCPSDPSWTSWEHPNTHIHYSLDLVSAGRLNRTDLDACYNLIEETSRADYEASTMGWKSGKKMIEMESPELRYILVKNPEGIVRGFTSLMPTYEEGEPVIYCYEIHLKPELQRTGLGRVLMSLLESVAAHTPPTNKVMLTCFLSNHKALAFYKAFGFTEDPISPAPKKLRYGREFVPDYVIMSKTVESKAVSTNTTSSQIKRN